MAALGSRAERALADPAGADIRVLEQVLAPRRGHVDLEMVAFGEDLHSEKIGPFPAGIEIKGPFRRVGHGVLGVKETFENPFLRFFRDADPIIVNQE